MKKFGWKLAAFAALLALFAVVVSTSNTATTTASEEAILTAATDAVQTTAITAATIAKKTTAQTANQEAMPIAKIDTGQFTSNLNDTAKTSAVMPSNYKEKEGRTIVPVVAIVRC